MVQVRGLISKLRSQCGYESLVNWREIAHNYGVVTVSAYRLRPYQPNKSHTGGSYDPVSMADLQSLLADMHEEVILQVLDDLKNGDRKARQEAMALLKQNNVSATAAEGSTLRQLAGKLDFSGMADKVVELKRPPEAV